MYILRKTFKLLKKNILIYLLVFLQIIIGFSMAVYSGNIKNDIEDYTNSIKNIDPVNKLEVSEKNKSSTGLQIITPKMYKEIKELTPVETTFFIEKNIEVLDGQNISEFKIIFLDLDRIGLKKGYAYGNKEIGELTKKENFDEIDLGNIKIKPQGKIDINKLGVIDHDRLFINKETLENNLLMDLSEYKEKYRSDEESTYLLFSRKMTAKEKNKVENFLNEKYKKTYEFTIISRENEFEGLFNPILEYVRDIEVVGEIMLISLIICLFVIYKKIIDKRRQEIGVSMAVGASNIQIFMGVFLEVFMVLGISFLLSYILGNLVFLKLSFLDAVIEPYINRRITLVFLGNIIVLPLVISLYSVFFIKKKNIIDLLNGN